MLRKVREVVRGVARVFKVLYDPIEQARAKRRLGGCILGLIVALSAKGIVNYISNNKLSNPPQGLSDMSSMANKALDLFTWVATVIAALLLIYYAIKYKTAE